MPAWSEKGSKPGQPAKNKAPAWMGTASGQGPRRPEPMWKPSAAQQADPEARPRAIRNMVAALAALLVAGFVYVLIFPLQPTALIALTPTAYPFSMPPVAFAEEDAQQLTKVSPSNVRVLSMELAKTGPSLAEFQKQVKAAGALFTPFRRGSDVVIVHIAAHGMVNERGEPCLVPPQEDSVRSGAWLPVAEIFKALREETKLQGKKKLVILDCQRVACCWRCGWLDAGFGDSLAGLISAEKDPTLYVMTAAGPGQIAAAAPELRSSVFGHFLARALKGEAGGSDVSLIKLFSFVAAKVEEYSQQVRGLPQQPALLHGDHVFRVGPRGQLLDESGEPARLDDYTVAYVDWWRRNTRWQSAFDSIGEAKRLLGKSDVVSVERSGTSSSLRQVWQRYRDRRGASTGQSDGAATLPGYVCDPVAWSSIQQRLAAIGERLWAGHQYQGLLQAEIDRLASDLNEKKFLPRGAVPKLDVPQSVAAALAENSFAPASDGNLLEAYAKAEPANRQEAIPRNVPRQRLVANIYSALTQDAAGADARSQLALAAELLKVGPPSDTPIDLIEGQFITLLDRGCAPQQPMAFSALAAALKTRQAAEAAANPADLRVHYALDSIVNAADQKRREAEDLFYLDARRPAALFSEANGNADARSGYAGASSLGQRLGEFLRLRDEVWADLPLLAEWHVIRGRLGASQQAGQPLADLYPESIHLSDCIELALQSPDESSLKSCQEAYGALVQSWQLARQEVEDVCKRTGPIETYYSRAADFREAELVLRQAPAVDDAYKQVVERYQQTLDKLATQADSTLSGSRSEKPSDEKRDSPPTRQSALSAAKAGADRELRLLRELHKALSYEFVEPYDKQRYFDDLEKENPDADRIFRSEASTVGSTWLRLRALLDTYNKSLKEPVWSSSQRAFAAAAKLRQWDKRVRIAGAWLSSVEPGLRPATQPTPARWLQEYDAAHLTAWQAYRALGDFWGSGVAGSSTNPYFAQAIDQSDAVFPTRLRPFQYDLPQGGVADLDEEKRTALAVLQQWQPIQFPPTLNPSSAAGGENKIDVAIQPPAESGKQPKVPPGTATLSIASPDAAAISRARFDATGEVRRQAVKLPPAQDSPAPFTAYLEQASGSTANLEARFWYRGHLRTRPCPADNGAYVQYEFSRPHYAAPTVEVRGKDTVRGAVLFIFDCSSSMRDPDGRFADAKQALKDVLKLLDGQASGGLRVGLMVYGRRTPADGDAPVYYNYERMFNDSNNLTPLGESMKASDPGFPARFPHPDRDVETVVPLANGTAAAVLGEVGNLEFKNCRGVTPLYYAIGEAFRHGFSGLDDQAPGARQIIVISDGVSMPYDAGLDRKINQHWIGANGKRVNEADYNTLDKVLKANKGSIRVSVQLFGQLRTDLEKQQFKDLKTLEAGNSNLTAVNLVNAKRLFQSIIDSLPKSKLELRSEQNTALAQPLEFSPPEGPDRVASVKEWGVDGLLRSKPDRRKVSFRRDGEARNVEQEIPLALLGGERVVLRENSSNARLEFLSDGLTPIASKKVKAPNPDELLNFDALDPERTRRTITQFRFRLREEESAQRFTQRPSYVWLEVKPRGAGGAAADMMIFPCLDVAWKEDINLPVLQMPVERWPVCPGAHVQVWFRYQDPVALHTATIKRGQSGTTLSVPPDQWVVEQTGGEAGAARTIRVTRQPKDTQPGIEKLLDRTVWLSESPDVIRRYYAIDGSKAIHEFLFTRPEAMNVNVELRIVARDDFQKGAYSAECDFDVAN